MLGVETKRIKVLGEDDAGRLAYFLLKTGWKRNHSYTGNIYAYQKGLFRIKLLLIEVVK